MLENQEFNNPPFVQSVQIFNTVLNDPGSVAPNLDLLPPALGATETDWKQPYVQEWSLDVQRELLHNVTAGSRILR